MIEIIDKAKCCGCGACAGICPKAAISMLPDALGFLYPKVNVDLCVNCGLCDEVCAFKHESNKSDDSSSHHIYAVRHKDIIEVERSRSGAAFVALSDYILEEGGIVYGAGYKDHFKVVHKRAQNKEERDEFRGSKYVQSEIHNLFKDVQHDLREGRKVLFSGTPCQAAAIRSFLRDDLQEHLYLVDIICHGVPSPYIWRDYLKYIEKIIGEPVVSLSFRDKINFGWTAHVESFQGKSSFISSESFKYLFYKHIMLRKSCSKCPFTNFDRPSDVTLGDYWGWQKTNKEFNKDDRGCSLLLLNTRKGMDWFEMVKGQLNFIPVKKENCLQTALQMPFPRHPHSDLFEIVYKWLGFNAAFFIWGDRGWIYKIKTTMKKLLSKI